MSLGPLMLNIEGIGLSAEDHELLAQPVVGGVVLFSRNFESPTQLRSLVDAIHALREPRLLVAVDQEGGRVQRFRDGFTPLPAPAHIGNLYDKTPERALALARDFGWLLGSELRAEGVDLTFAPVLDLRRQPSGAIGDRAFHPNPETVAELARQMLTGLADAGMLGVGKHFPGHGSVRTDSHRATPTDPRDLETVAHADMLVFERLIHYGLAAVMSAHIVFPRVDTQLVSCSSVWLKDILRGRLGFSGALFSDDLVMKGAAPAGTLVERAQAALDAGTDMILVCNDREGAIDVIDGLRWAPDPVAGARLARMRGRKGVEREQLVQSPRFVETERALLALEPDPELDLPGDC